MLLLVKSCETLFPAVADGNHTQALLQTAVHEFAW